jgi:hypothetical protein
MTELEPLYIVRRRECHQRGKCTGPLPLHPDEWCGCRVHSDNEFQAWKARTAIKLLSFVAGVLTAIILWTALVGAQH